MRFRAATLFIAVLWPPAVKAQALTEFAKVERVVRQLDPQPDDKPTACQVTPILPAPDFAFRLQAGYSYRVPLRPHSGSGHGWVNLVEVKPEEGTRPPAYLLDLVELPEVPRSDMDWNGQGGFLLGEGRYQVRWLMVDDLGRVCRKQWKIDTHLHNAGHGAPVLVPPNTVSDLSGHGLERPAPAQTAMIPRLTILMDAAPLKAGTKAKSELSLQDRGTLADALSGLMALVPAASVRLVVFNLEQQKELFRQDSFTLDSLGDVHIALRDLQLAKIDVRVLEQGDGYLSLLANLINTELSSKPAPSGIIFLGPQERYQNKVPPELLKGRGSAGLPIVFLRLQPHELHIHSNPGSGFPGGGTFSRMRRRASPAPAGATPNGIPDDTITLTVRELAGKTIPVETPSDLAKALQEIKARLSVSGLGH